MKEWESIRDKLLIFKIENFAENILKIGFEHHIKPLKEYAENLLNKIKNMDFDDIKSSLAAFPDILETITGKPLKIVLNEE